MSTTITKVLSKPNTINVRVTSGLHGMTYIIDWGDSTRTFPASTSASGNVHTYAAEKNPSTQDGRYVVKVIDGTGSIWANVPFYLFPNLVVKTNVNSSDPSVVMFSYYTQDGSNSVVTSFGDGNSRTLAANATKAGSILYQTYSYKNQPTTPTPYNVSLTNGTASASLNFTLPVSINFIKMDYARDACGSNRVHVDVSIIKPNYYNPANFQSMVVSGITFSSSQIVKAEGPVSQGGITYNAVTLKVSSDKLPRDPSTVAVTVIYNNKSYSLTLTPNKTWYNGNPEGSSVCKW